MFKILIIAVVVIVLGTIVAAVNFLSPKPVTKTSSSDTVSSSTTEASSSGGLLDQIKNITSSPTPQEVSKISLEDHVKLLETTVSVLQKRLDVLEKNQGIKTVSPSSSPSTTTTVTAVPAYIPLGAGGNTNDQNYAPMDMYQVAIDPAEYPGYTNMQLEVSFKSDQNAGPTYIRLYNSTDSTSVSSSEVSGTSDKSTWLTSSKFTISSTKKTYTIQVKNVTNVNTNILSARLKVNF